MLKAKKVKIGISTYKIIKDGEMTATCDGQIRYDKNLITLRTKSTSNYSLESDVYMSVLMHEIVHGIDQQVFFIKSGTSAEAVEEYIELMTTYIIRNIHNFGVIDIFADFAEYCKMCGEDIVRIELFYDAIIELFNTNQKLIQEFRKVFK